ncbi:MAG: AAA family ATPase, partial [Actinobacteria bacterium]|nr:AAA family ATPase [Actinomycetota bacterium]
MVSKPKRQPIGYGALIKKAEADQILAATVNNDTGRITGTYRDGDKIVRYAVTGPHPLPDSDSELLRRTVPADKLNFDNATPNLAASLIPFLLPILLLIGFWVWFSRRAQGQMSGIMSIGRSKAKVYTTERPKTTFADVAGYAGVKQEIREVVDFLKSPGRFKEIGARIPKGVLLVGPPGTGKTMLARAVAGEAGVPFMSVTGSDFMEM